MRERGKEGGKKEGKGKKERRAWEIALKRAKPPKKGVGREDMADVWNSRNSQREGGSSWMLGKHWGSLLLGAECKGWGVYTRTTV